MNREKFDVDINLLDEMREGYNGWKNIEDKLSSEWRHGNIHTIVAKRKSDNKYFSVCYNTGPDGTGIKDNNYFPLDGEEVFEITKTVTVYE